MDGTVPRVRLSRPDKRNAVNADMATHFAAIANLLVERHTVMAVLEAEGPVFTAGADMSDMAAGARALGEMLDILTTLPLYWAAVVRQPTYGGGMALLAAAPLVIATPAATFCLPELARGFFPGPMMAGQVESVGLRAAYDMAFSAEAIDAHRGLMLGVANAVVAEDDIEDFLGKRSDRLERSPRAEVLTGVSAWQSAVKPALMQMTDHR